MGNKLALSRDRFMDLFGSKVLGKLGLLHSKLVVKYRLSRFSANVIPEEHVHEVIKDKLMGDSSFMLGRLGNTERHIIAEYMQKKEGMRTGYSDLWKEWLLSTSGFFVNSNENHIIENAIDELVQLYIEAIKVSDMEGIWYQDYESVIINQYAPKCEVAFINHTHIYKNESSWGMALEGKKVLVVSPFAESIKSQYLRKEKIWQNKTILPDFELITFVPPYTAVNNHPCDKSWFEVYKQLEREVLDIDFEIAILGCGVYGYPLAAAIKRKGKKVLDLCGNTQIVFGVYGERWKDAEFVNEYWIRPTESEKPKNYASVEGGCYW